MPSASVITGLVTLYDSGYITAAAATLDSGSGGFSTAFTNLRVQLLARGDASAVNPVMLADDSAAMSSLGPQSYIPAANANTDKAGIVVLDVPFYSNGSFHKIGTMRGGDIEDTSATNNNVQSWNTISVALNRAHLQGRGQARLRQLRGRLPLHGLWLQLASIRSPRGRRPERCRPSASTRTAAPSTRRLSPRHRAEVKVAAPAPSTPPPQGPPPPPGGEHPPDPAQTDPRTLSGWATPSWQAAASSSQVSRRGTSYLQSFRSGIPGSVQEIVSELAKLPASVVPTPPEPPPSGLVPLGPRFLPREASLGYDIPWRTHA